jgi:hypothetical protein
MMELTAWKETYLGRVLGIVSERRSNITQNIQDDRPDMELQRSVKKRDCNQS